MKNYAHTAAACVVAFMLMGCATDVRTVTTEPLEVRETAVRTMVNTWPETARRAANEAMDKYGTPDGVTETMLVWHDNGPWKRTIVYREEVDHRFPMPHKDVWEQFIDYDVPPGKFDELAAYDGSVIIERTKGEMSARCDKEAANFLALNLANEIATGQRSVEDARRMYGEQIQAMKAARPAPYTERLMFSPPASGNDSDTPIL